MCVGLHPPGAAAQRLAALYSKWEAAYMNCTDALLRSFIFNKVLCRCRSCTLRTGRGGWCMWWDRIWHSSPGVPVFLVTNDCCRLNTLLQLVAVLPLLSQCVPCRYTLSTSFLPLSLCFLIPLPTSDPLCNYCNTLRQGKGCLATEYSWTNSMPPNELTVMCLNRGREQETGRGSFTMM